MYDPQNGINLVIRYELQDYQWSSFSDHLLIDFYQLHDEIKPHYGNIVHNVFRYRETFP